MQRAFPLPRLGNWRAFLLMAGGFCIFAFIIPNLYSRYRYGLIEGLILGAFAGQFLWSVAWCALGPGRWLSRYLVVVALGMVIAGALIGGIYAKPETAMERREAQVDLATGQEFTRRERARQDVWQAALALPLSLLVCQLPLAWNRSYRGWRIIFREMDSPAPEAELLKFGLSEMLAAAAGAAIAFGFWRLEMSETLKGPYGTKDASVATFLCVFQSLLAGSLMLPMASFVLGDRPRHRALAWTSIYLVGIAMALVVARLLLDPPAAILGVAAALFAYLCAFLASTSVIFWIAREFGYRLFRARRRGLMERWKAHQREWPAIAKVKRLSSALFGRAGAFFEFAGIGCAAAATVCVLYWLLSLCISKADIGLMFRVEDEITVARGTVTISTILSSRPGQRGWANPSPPRRWKVPGLEIEHLEDYGGRTWLTVKFSLLIPGLAFAMLAAFFLRQHKRARKALAAAGASGFGTARARTPPVSD